MSDTLNFVLSQPNHAADRIEALEAALRDVIILTESEEFGSARDVIEVAQAALAPEQDE